MFTICIGAQVDFLENANVFLTLFFLCEMLLKIFACGILDYLAEPFNRFDVSIPLAFALGAPAARPLVLEAVVRHLRPAILTLHLVLGWEASVCCRAAPRPRFRNRITGESRRCWARLWSGHRHRAVILVRPGQHRPHEKAPRISRRLGPAGRKQAGGRMRLLVLHV